MVRKKIDNRIRILIENGVKLGHRTLFAIIGDKARDQVAILHQMLTKAEVKAQPTVLWCYKKDLGFSSHQMKRMKHDQRRFQAGKLNINEDDPFEVFRTSTKIRYCYYSETHKILGNTFGMCVLQDFEALTPNLLARTIETVEGGGLIIILLRSVASLKRLYTMRMDVHDKYRTEVHQNVTCRFNERFFLSLTSCKRCLVVDDQLSVLPITPHTLHVTPEEARQEKSINEVDLDYLKTELRDTEPVGSLVNCCRTLDQGKALLKFIEAISEKTLRSTVSLTAARGRGKSATLGLSVAAAIAFGYSNIFVTSPSPENLKTFFEFVFKGLEALEYQERSDYEINTHPDFNKAVVKVKITRDHLQTIQYIHPKESQMLLQAQLVVIDEAAAIPLPFVKSLLGPYLVFLASTINGYEGTGRSLSLKLLQQLRVQVVPLGANTNAVLKKDTAAATGRTLHEITLEESIRYKPGDLIEQWLTKLLCLDANSVTPLLSGCPSPDNCDLYYVSRDTLFSYNDATEEFLQRLVALLVASHYKNSPDDLQMMSDAPGHHLFCLLGPVDANRKKLPEVLVIIHVSLEGQIPSSSMADGSLSNKRPSGDIIPWTVSHEFSDPDFSQLCGARIVRIATHPDYQGMGYGSRALQLLKDYYELKIPNLNEVEENVNESSNEDNDDDDELGFNKTIKPKTSLPPLLLKLSERRPERLNYLGVSFGLSERVLKFWKKAGYIPVYVKSKANDLTGEHSCIMLNVLKDDDLTENDWLLAYWTEFRTRFVELLGYQVKQFSSELGLSLLINTNKKLLKRPLSRSELEYNFTSYGLKSLEKYKYSNNADYDSIMHLVPTLSKLYFLNQMGDLELPKEQATLVLGIGLQRKIFGDLAAELGHLPAQVQAFFKQVIIKFSQYLNSVLEDDIAKTLVPTKDVQMRAVGTTLQQELDDAAKELEKKQKKELQKLKNENLAQFAIKGSEDEWGQVLTKKGKKNIISIKSGEKRLHESNGEVKLEEKTERKKKKNEKKRKKT